MPVQFILQLQQQCQLEEEHEFSNTLQPQAEETKRTSEVKTREAAASGTYMVFRSLVNGLDVTLHLKNLEAQELLAHKITCFLLTEYTFKSDGI